MNLSRKKTPPNSFSISDATVLGEEKNIQSNKIENKIEESYINNLKDQKVVELKDVGKKPIDEKATIDFMNEDHVTSFTASKAKESTSNEGSNSKSMFEGETSDSLRDKIKDAESSFQKQFTPDDFKEIAQFLITLIDTGISSALKWWSKDTTDAPYSLGKEKQNKLVYQLTLLLVKYQAKFSLEFMFLLTILFMYAGPFLAARKRVKENKDQLRVAYVNPDMSIINNNNQNQTENKQVVNSEIINQNENESKIKVVRKRANHRPPKA